MNDFTPSAVWTGKLPGAPLHSAGVWVPALLAAPLLPASSFCWGALEGVWAPTGNTEEEIVSIFISTLTFVAQIQKTYTHLQCVFVVLGMQHCRHCCQGDARFNLRGHQGVGQLGIEESDL